MILRAIIFGAALVLVIFAAYYHATAKIHYRNGDIRNGDKYDKRGDGFFAAAMFIALAFGVVASLA